MKTIYILIVTFLLIFLSSCTKILNDFEFVNKDPKIVIQAKLNPDSIGHVFITRSLDMFDKREVKPIANASVSLFDENEKELIFTQDSIGWYSINPGNIKHGITYRMEVTADGFPAASSEFSIPVLPQIFQIDTSKVRVVSTGYYSGPQVKGRCSLQFNDNPDTEDYYLISLRRDNFYETDWDTLGKVIDSIFHRESLDISSESPYLEYVYGLTSGYRRADSDFQWNIKKLLFSDRLFNGKNNVTLDILFPPDYQQVFEGDELKKDSIILIVESVDKHLFGYAKAKAEMDNAMGNPLSEPVTPYSSVSEGFGLVYGVDKKEYQVDVTGLFSADDYYTNVYY